MQDVPHSRRVAATQIDNIWVSTVRLSADTGPYGDGPPMRYETMAFSCDDAGNVTNLSELLCEWYATEQEAVEGHSRIVAEIKVLGVPQE